MPILEFKNVSKWYDGVDGRTTVLKNVNLTVEEGEFICIIGFSGSGKTTLISLIEGLIFPDEGEVLINGNPVEGPGYDRSIVFQNYSLLPWLNVHDNVNMAVKQAFPNKTSTELTAHSKRFVEMVNLTPALEKTPKELSGGMRQRVSVARALAMNPQMLLLDEPLSALDALTRGTLQDEIANIWNQDKKTVIMVTNDIDEGLILADRIIALTPGPGAHFGADFPVHIPRPRNKTELNHNDEFKTLRNKITKYMLEINSELKDRSDLSDLVLPDIKPVVPQSIWKQTFKR